MKVLPRPSIAATGLCLWLLALSLVHNRVLSDTGLIINDLDFFVFALAPVVAGALIGGLGSLLGSGISYASQRDAQTRQNAANRALAEYQYSKDLEMWNRQNLFNMPSAQMARLKQAGLNPNMVYGTGSAAGITSGSMPRYQAPQMRYDVAIPQDIFSGVIGAYQDYQVKAAQIDNLREQRYLTSRNIDLKAQQYQMASEFFPAKFSKAWEDAWLTEQKRKQGAALFPSQLQFAAGRLSQQEKQIAKLDVDTELQRKKTDWFVTKLFGDLASQAVRGVTQVLPPGRMGKVAGKLSPGTVRPRYNSPSSWEQMLRNR